MRSWHGILDLFAAELLGALNFRGHRLLNGPVPTTTDVFIRHRITYCIAIYVEENARYGILIHYENYGSPEN